MLPTNAERVPQHTSEPVNADIERRTLEALERAAAAGKSGIEDRLRLIDQEWDIERAIEANAASLALTGTLLGAFVNPWFLVLPAAVTAFLLQHALQGWCPPVPVLRRFHFRTQSEIEQERTALKLLRGDFNSVNAGAPGIARTAFYAAKP